LGQTIRHISVQFIPEIWRKERLSILLPPKRQIRNNDIRNRNNESILDTPMLPAEVFVKTVNGIFEGMLNV